jgi:hypothetical protein
VRERGEGRREQDFLVALCGKKRGPHSPQKCKIIFKNSLSLTNFTLISLKY